MTESKDDRKLNMIVTLVLWCVICTACMAAMLVTASGKDIVIADAAQDGEELLNEEAQGANPRATLLFQDDETMERMLCIPLEDGIKAENVIMENRYVDRELWIYIQQAQSPFYDINAIRGDIDWVEDGWYEVREERIILKLVMSDVMEYRSTLDDGMLKISFVYPKEMYDQVVVIDPMGGGSESGITVDGCAEKDLACGVAKLLQKKNIDSNIKLYFTRTEDVEISAAKRLQLVEAVDADLYLRIGASENRENESAYGIQAYYNEEYYIPDFGSVQWADIVTQKVTIAASNRAIGLKPAEEGNLLRQLKIPAAQINLGFLTNQAERILLQQDAYQEKLAQGIADAILEAYTNKWNQQVGKSEE